MALKCGKNDKNEIKKQVIYWFEEIFRKEERFKKPKRSSFLFSGGDSSLIFFFVNYTHLTLNTKNIKVPYK